jgi:1-acyl-sn-glycerol-3-phosphate acyltransferase
MSTIDNVADIFEIEQARSMVSRERLVNNFAKVTQFVTWPILYILFNLFFKIRIRGQEIFQEKKIKTPFMIIANHTAFYDSFLFRLVLGFDTPYLPLRFMAVTKFENPILNFLKTIGLVDFIYSLFGVFTVTPGLGIDKNIKTAKEIIRIGGNIVIYPEGRIVKSGKIEPFKKGAAVLYKETNVRVVPVSFHPSKGSWFRKNIDIEVGDEICITEYLSPDEVSRIFHRVISNLYNKKFYI